MQAPYFNTHFTAEKILSVFVSSHPVTILSYHFFSSIKVPKKKIHVRIDERFKCGLKWFLRILTHVFKAQVFLIFGIEYFNFFLPFNGHLFAAFAFFSLTHQPTFYAMHIHQATQHARRTVEDCTTLRKTVKWAKQSEISGFRYG